MSLPTSNEAAYGLLSTLSPWIQDGGTGGLDEPDFNTTVNGTEEALPEFKSPYTLWQAILIVTILGIITIGTILGNALVCVAVGIVKKLQTPSNLLIVSLAVSDLLVALLVMPFAASYEVLGQWVHGEIFCDAWTSLDVMLCTASILNLCMISIDRYFVITRPFQYAVKRTPKLMAVLITAVWVGSALISIPPIFGWKSEATPGICMVSQAIGYQFYATIGAFYLPLAIMIVIYYRIYMLSSRIAQHAAKSQPSAPSSHRPSGEENHNLPNGAIGKRRADARDADETTQQMLPKSQKAQRKFFKFMKRNKDGRKLSSSKEHKATKTLGVIMGAFTACWLPFFILALIRPFCHTCIPNWLNGLFLWLGYANSFLNPIIYARFNRDFRTPFKEILLCRCMGINIRLRSESYAEQYGAAPAPSNLRDCIRPPVDTVVRYHSQGQTIVKLGNGEACAVAQEACKV